jgi:Phage Terminase
MNKPKKPVTIIDAIQHKQLLGSLPAFQSLDTWQSWLIWLKAIHALPMDDDELSIYRECTGRTAPPTVPPTEVYTICGRRGGKSFISSLVAAYTACFNSYERYLNAGEKAVVLCLARDKDQARIIFSYIHGILNAIEPLRQLITAERSDEIELGRVVVMVKPSDFRAVRGLTLALVILDEFSFFDIDGATPSREVLVALRPGMVTLPGSKLIAISSAYIASGSMYEAHRDYFGKDNDHVFVWQATTRQMNPTVSEEKVRRELELDPDSAKAEWLSEFRTDITAAFDPEALQACVIQGRDELPPSPIIQYAAFVDPSGGKHDSFTLCIGHKESGVVIDKLAAWPSPFDPGEVVAEIAQVLKSYGVLNISGDNYAGEWPRSEFAKHGIQYERAEKVKSDLYLAFIPTVNSKAVELPDDKRLLTEFRRLLRKRGRGGRDTIDHPSTGSDDRANAVAGISYLLTASVEKSQTQFNPSLHIAQKKLTLMTGNWPLFVALSYGDGIAASVIAQTYNDEVRVFAAFCTEGISLRRHLEQFTKSWLITHAHRLQLFGGYEDITDAQLKSEIFLTASEVLQGQWALITKSWEIRRDDMLNALVKAVPYKFIPAVQFCPTNTLPLSQALSSGRYREKLQADRKNFHVVNSFSILLARLELWKAMPKSHRPRPLPPSAWSA